MTLTEDAKALLARIVAEPGKMGGKPIIRGRRITPGMVLALLARGATRADVLDAYPALEAADIDACLLYGARLAERADADVGDSGIRPAVTAARRAGESAAPTQS